MSDQLKAAIHAPAPILLARLTTTTKAAGPTDPEPIGCLDGEIRTPNGRCLFLMPAPAFKCAANQLQVCAPYGLCECITAPVGATIGADAISLTAAVCVAALFK